MQTTFAVLALIGAVAAQGVPAGTLLPSESAPAGCSGDYNGKFEITVVKAPGATKRDIVKRDNLVCTLAGGVLTDALGRIGGIVANRQFQFDGPPSQTGTIYNGGWSVCNNGSLAIGGTNVFYQCLSGDFYNLYDQSTGAQCEEVLIDIIPMTGSGSSPVTQTADGQPAGPGATQISDGQIQASSAVAPVTQISDGQIQGATGVPVSQFTDGQIQATAPAPAPAVSQISDGQIQATSAAAPAPAVSQISDGQIQATSAAAPAPAPVTQISDGQVQATSAGSPVTQISDGQIQATSAAPVPVTQISDGQIQATTLVPVTQIGDGQVQAGNATATTTAAAQFTGAANSLTFAVEAVAAAVGVAAIALL